MLRDLRRSALLGATLTFGVLCASTGTAAAQNADCGAKTPAGETAVSSYAQLQSDVALVSGGTFYLTTSLADGTGSGGLAPYGQNPVTIDLNGCSLSITHAATGVPAIQMTGASTSLTITDSSANDDGTLTAVGGAGSGTTGGGAGIGAPSASGGGANGAGGTLTVKGGTVSATGGAAPAATSATAGAGVGAGGTNAGATGDVDGSGNGVIVDSGGTLVATGGAATASGNTGIPGVGLGGNRDGGGVTLAGGTLRATGGSGNTAGAAGIGGGFNGAELSLQGGNLAVAGGQGPSGTAWGLGPSTSAGTRNSNPTGTEVFVSSGTTTVSGSFLTEFDGAAAATIDVAPGATWQVSSQQGIGESVFYGLQGPVNVPTNSSLQLTGYLAYAGTGTLNNVNVTSTGSLDLDGGSSTLTNLTGAGPVDLGGATATLTSSDANWTGSLSVDPTSTLDVPAGQTVSLNAASTNAGTINVAGTLTGTGSLDNEGAILFSGSGSIPGYGWQSGDLRVSGYRYYVEFPVPPGANSPAGQWLWAKSFAAGGETIPAEPTVPGYTIAGNWELNGTPLDAAGTIGSQPEGNVVLAGDYLYDTSSDQRPAFGSVSLGNAISDTATVAGGSYYGVPTGTVSFYVCGPLTGAAGCSSTNNAVGSPIAVGAGSGNNATATSSSYVPTATGTYCFYAVYSGDGQNEPSHASGGDGCFTVTPGSTGGGNPSDATATSAPTVSPTQPTAGTAATLTANVTDTSHSSVTVNSGEVAFLINGSTTVCIAEVINGVATCETSSLPAGTDTLTARYNGATGFTQSAVSGPVTVTVLASNQMSVAKVAARSRARLAVGLQLAGAGKVHVSVMAGGHTLATGTSTVRGKRPKLTLTLHLRAPRALLHGRHASARQKVELKITYSPTGGHTRTITKILTLKLSQL